MAGVAFGSQENLFKLFFGLEQVSEEQYGN
jgi:hypothetical protein